MKYKPLMNHLQWITLRSLITTHFLNVIYYKQFNNSCFDDKAHRRRKKNFSAFVINLHKSGRRWALFFALNAHSFAFLIANELVQRWLIINDD